MKRLIFVLFLLASLSACKKEHVDPLSGEKSADDSTRKLIRKIVSHYSENDSYKIQLYTYNTQGLVTKICTYDSLTPQNQDSILFFYTTGKVSIKKTYNAFYDAPQPEKSYNYDYLGRLSSYYEGVAGDSGLEYHYTDYNLTAEVEYIIKVKNGLMQDSIAVYPAATSTYVGKGQGNTGLPDNYLDLITTHYFKTENGVYLDLGTLHYPYDVLFYGDSNSNKVVCIDRDINFQDEVACSFLSIGQAGYMNMYPKRAPYKYPLATGYVLGLTYDYLYYNTVYTFDTFDRLSTITSEYSGPQNNNLGIPYHGTLTKTIYY